MYHKGDFHIHSTASDGELNGGQIVEFAKNRNTDIIAITDHNSTMGVEEAINAGIENNVTVVPGVELSTRFNNQRVHILGYFRDDKYKDKDFQRCLRLIKARRIKEVKRILKNIVEIEICNKRLSVLSGIKLLKSFGAVVVLAHPVLINKKDLTQIVNYPFDGIEAKYYRNEIEDTEFFLQLAKDMDILYTAGSDFHTNMHRDIKHGLIGEIYLNSEEIEVFLTKSKLNKYM